jgi:uroporphyrinogen-III synthase
VITVCSPSAVRAVASEVSADVLVVCLGATTAEAARKHGLRVDAVATSTSMPALIAAVETALGAHA